MAKTRKRRTAEAAREEILTAAEARLIAGGPAGLRLQELAAEMGVSHPAILHHFGSREGLVSAVVQRAIGNLQQDLMAAIAGAGPRYDGVPLLDRVYEMLATHGHARLMAWLLLSGYEPLDGPEVRAGWKKIIDMTHAARVATTKDNSLSREDTAFTVVLSALAVFGQAIAGPTTFAAAGLGRSAKAQAQVRAWLSARLGEHLSSGLGKV